MPDRAYISKITLPSGSTYYIKDEEVRELIRDIEKYTRYLGVTTTALTDGATTNPITINGESVTAESGNIVTYNNKEFIFNGTAWQEFGDLSGLGSLAYKNSASGNFTPAGSVGQPTFTGTTATVTVTGTPTGNVTITTADNTNGNYQPKGSVSLTAAQQVLDVYGSYPIGTQVKTYTPEGSVSLSTRDLAYYVTPTIEGSGDGYTPAGSITTPTISRKTEGTKTSVNSITSDGSLPAWGATVSNEELTISWNAGSTPTHETVQNVRIGDATYQASTPTFNGTPTRFTVVVPTAESATFTGTDVKLTTSVNVPTSASFTGTKAQINGTFTGDTLTSTGSFKPEGTVSKPTFTGTQGTVTVS